MSNAESTRSSKRSLSLIYENDELAFLQLDGFAAPAQVPTEQAVNRWTTLLEESQEGATSCVNLLSETLPH